MLFFLYVLHENVRTVSLLYDDVGIGDGVSVEIQYTNTLAHTTDVVCSTLRAGYVSFFARFKNHFHTRRNVNTRSSFLKEENSPYRQINYKRVVVFVFFYRSSDVYPAFSLGVPFSKKL